MKAEVDITLIPNFLHLTYVRNTGAAWSIFSGRMGLLALISFLVGSAIIFVRIKYRGTFSTFKKVLFALVLSGAWGNFIDRAFYNWLTGTPGVVDFIHFQFRNYHFPIFNVADICITLGIIMYIVLLFVEEIKGSKVTKTEANAEVKEGQAKAKVEDSNEERDESNND